MDRISVIRAESDRLADVLARAESGSPVPTCPDWTASDLLWHVVEVHDFWARILSNDVRDDAGVAEIEADKPARPAAIDDVLALRADATARLVDALGRFDDDDPRWSWWPDDQTVGFTRRMQTYEATMHRVDAELTAGVAVSPIAADVASGAIDHAVDVMWGWMPDWATYEPTVVAQFRATDTGGTWLVEVGHWFGTGPESGNQFDMPRAVRATGGEPALRVAAPVEQLARWAWTRQGSADVDGEPTDALDALIANGIQ
jgi:uncharacterized protein (TIGR03083 family)